MPAVQAEIAARTAPIPQEELKALVNILKISFTLSVLKKSILAILFRYFHFYFFNLLQLLRPMK
jgi:hypothetical protein